MDSRRKAYSDKTGKQLNTLNNYAGTLLHECAHAISDASDVSRDFEEELTNIIGCVVDKVINNRV